VFAMANPIPEIWPDEARAAGASVVGTGRSDFPNQINNSLVFPGVFRGGTGLPLDQSNHSHEAGRRQRVSGSDCRAHT